NAPKKRRSSIGRSSLADEIIDLDNDKDDETPCLYVMEVPPACDDEELRNFHETLFGVMSKKNIQPKMITTTEVLSVRSSSPDFYVLPQFSGPEFDHLIKKGCKIIGPFVVDRCIKTGARLPKWRHPIYALSMEGAVVCFSGLAKGKKNELSELVKRMGGIVSSDLHDKVTVLIAKSCDTSYLKYTESAKLKIPILREDWITDAWRAITEGLTDESVTNIKNYDRHRVPLFTNMVITVSGLKTEDRNNAGRMIEMGMGKFSTEMVKKTCTHLITDKNSGEKFRKAREWGSIRIVTLKWLIRSVEMGYVQKEGHYDPERVRASTPTKGAKPPDDLDFSMVAPAPSGPGGLNNSTLSIGFNLSINTTTRTLNDCSVVKSSFMRHDSSRRMTLLESEERTMEEEGRAVDATQDIDPSTMQGDADFFEGLRILLVGVPEVRESWWRRLINWSGASRAMKVDGATHVVVVGGIVDKAILISGKPVLTTEWVAACMKTKRMMPHADFVYGHQSSLSRASSSSHNQSLITSVNGPMKKTPAKSTQSTRPSQVQIASSSTRKSSSMRSVAGGGGEMFVPPSSASFSSLSTRRSSLPRPAILPVPSSSVGTTKMFRGVTFKMSDAICEEEAEELKEMIMEGGGSVVSDVSSSAHYLLCTLLHFGSIVSPSDHNTQDIVSLFWLYHCLDTSSIISPSSHPLYRPIPACKGSSFFEGLVISMVGFAYEQEQLAYETLLVHYGATIGNNVGRPVARATHIVAGGALQNGTKMPPGGRPLDPSWLIECIIHDKVLLEDDFLFKTSPYASYNRSDDLWLWEKCEERRAMSREGDEISGRGEKTVVLQEGAGGPCGESDAILDMGAFDDEMEGGGGGEMDRTEAMEDNGEEDSMVREITEEMEIDGEMEERREEKEEKGRTTQHLPPPTPIAFVNTSTPRGKTQNSVHHPRLQVLRSAVSSSTPSRHSSHSIPALSSPSQFLHPTAIPRIVIAGADELIDDISSPCHSEMDRSIDQLSASGVGRMLDGMVVTTGRENSHSIETPIRGTSAFEERERPSPSSRGQSTSNGWASYRANILDSSRLERGRRRREESGGRDERGEEREEREGSEASGMSRDTMDVDEDSPRESMVVASLDIQRRQKELAEKMAATIAMGKKDEEERAETTTNSGTTTTSGEKGTSEGGKGGGERRGVRSRRKRLALEDIQAVDAKRPPLVPLSVPFEEKAVPSPIPMVGWAEAPIEYSHDDANADHSRILDSPIKAPIRREPTAPSTSTTSTVRSTVADRSMGSKSMNRSTTTARPLITPAKTLRARLNPAIDEKTQEAEKSGFVGEKSAKKAKSTAAISRRGRGKENERGFVFALTSVDAEMKDRLTESIRALGGTMSLADGYDTMVTHVISGE
ncbi:hypothetical protein PFISCL1PPCAC_19337, partial [Pristionchus fissidentatus]